METKTYIRKGIKGYYLETSTEIDAEYWNGWIGSTYDDFLDGKWILLSDEQVAFHNENPDATIEEVINTHLAPSPIHTRTLEDAKRDKISQIEEYDSSDAVNSFDIIIEGNTVTTWIDPNKRSNYKNSLDSAELLGLTEVHPVFNGVQLTLPIQTAKSALAQIQIYADRCYIVTETHKANVNSLDTIEAVDAYDNETGYPEKLIFTL